MFRNRVKSLLVLVAAVLPVVAAAQIHERGMMRNRTNVETESSSYTIGIVRDTNKLNTSFIQFANNSIEDDAAAESEDDTLRDVLPRSDDKAAFSTLPLFWAGPPGRKIYTS